MRVHDGLVAVIALAAVMGLLSCGDSGRARVEGVARQPSGDARNPLSPTLPPAPRGNLLPNGSFEVDGQPSLEGWRVIDPALTEVVPDPAPGGGSWGLRLEADWAPTSGLVMAPVPGATSGLYLLRAWVRAVDETGGGAIALAVGKSYERVKTVSTIETSWTPLTILTPVRIDPGDTLWVVLTSLHTEVVRRQGVFDRVWLERARSRGRTMGE